MAKRSLWICEKRTAAQELAKSGFFGNLRQNGLFLENGDYVIAHAAGHLFRMFTPREHNPQKYGIAFHPVSDYDYFAPEMPSLLKTVPDTNDYSPLVWNSRLKKYAPDKNADNIKRREYNQKLLDSIADLLKGEEWDSVVVATDTDAEGERIGSDIVQHFKALMKPHTTILRFWHTGQFSAKKAVEEAFRDMKPLADTKYQNLLNSQIARSNSDALVGFIGSKYYSDHCRKSVNVGRVQTALLGMVGRREETIRDFIPRNYANVRGGLLLNTKNKKVDEKNFSKLTDADVIKFNHFFEEWDEDDNGKRVKVKKTQYFDKSQLERMLSECQNANFTGTVISNDSKESYSGKPLPFHTDQFNALFMKAHKVSLDYSNACLEYLRDNGYSTYPRTNGNYFRTTELEAAQGAVDFAAEYFSDKIKALGIPPKKLMTSQNCFNDAKAETQGHVPLHILKTAESQMVKEWEKGVHYQRSGGQSIFLKHLKEAYELIATRCLVQAYDDEKSVKDELLIEIAGHRFSATAQRVISQGWKALDPYAKSIKNSELNTDFKSGDTITLDNIFPLWDTTKPPPHYNQQSLLNSCMFINDTLMEEIELELDEVKQKEKRRRVREIKKALTNANGLGTQGTRETIFKKLDSYGLFEYTKKNQGGDITLSEKGWYMYSLVPDILKSIETTAIWEQNLEDIRNGKLSKEQFIDNIMKMIASMQSQPLNNTKGNTNMTQKAPTERQLNYLKKIAKILKMDENAPIHTDGTPVDLDSMSDCSRFIDENKDKASELERWQLSDKQINILSKNEEQLSKVIGKLSESDAIQAFDGESLPEKFKNFSDSKNGFKPDDYKLLKKTLDDIFANMKK